MHIFVTGGTGFFGRALLRYWATNHMQELSGARFTLISRDPEKFRIRFGKLLDVLNAKLVQGDIQYADSLPKGDYTHILHAATDSTAGLELTPLQRFDQIVTGSRNVLELALRCDNPRVLITSSGGVYGDISKFTDGVTEDYTGFPEPLLAHNAYSIAKRQVEHLCALYHNVHGLRFVVARCFAFVGEDLPLDAHFAIGNFIRDAIEGNDIVIQGDGSPIRSYMDQRDLANWLTTMLLKANDGRAYNVGSDKGYSILDVANRVAELAPRHSSKVKLLKRTVSGQSANRKFYLPNIGRAQDELGLISSIGLDDAISHVFRQLGY